MKSKRPYLTRAYYDWIVDNNFTPCLLVDTRMVDVRLPESFLSEDQVVLNVAPEAIREFEISDKAISFLAQFSGITSSVFVPLVAVLAVYAYENGQGIFFEHEEELTISSDDGKGASKRKAELHSVAVTDTNTSESAPKKEAETGKSNKKRKGRPSLKIIK